MNSHIRVVLVLAGYAAATLCAIASPIAAFSDIIGIGAIRIIGYGSATVFAALFAHLVLSQESRRAIDAATNEMQNDASFRFGLSGLSHDEWGLFGRKMGNDFLLVLRAILFVEFLVAVFTMHRATTLSQAAPQVCGVLGFMVAVLLTVEQLRAHYPR